MNIITPQMKQMFNSYIDMILADDGLTVPCILKYNSTKYSFCNNCVYDNMLNQSSNIYNGSGPINFPAGTICPVCGGFGKVDYDSSEKVNLAVILDSKYWLNWGPKFVNIPNISAQTLCKVSLLNKINNCNQAILNTLLPSDNIYTKAGAPTPLGFGNHDYILTNWTRP